MSTKADDKQMLRNHCVQTRKHLSPAIQASASISICAQIQSLEHYQKAKHIAIYHAIKGEVDLSHLQGKICYFPTINTDQTLTFLPVTPETVFYNNRFGIPEPDVKRELALSPEKLDIIFLPVVAFDEHGTRLGLGGGYYDKTLAHHRAPLLIGVAYEVQCQPLIPREAWDVPMNAVITERTIHWSKS